MGQQKTRYVHQVFERIAEGYDAANDRISFGMQRFWKSCLVREVCRHLRGEERFLDLCCGTGDIARAVAIRRKRAAVTGIDLSDAMLKVAERKGGVSERILWERGDVRKLPFEDKSVQAAAISFGLRNVDGYEAALKEIWRVLKPGGCFCCLDSYVPDGRLVRPFYEGYFRWLMPLLGGGERYRREYAHLYRSTRGFLSKKELARMMEQTGFRSVRYRSFFFGVCGLHVGRRGL